MAFAGVVMAAGALVGCDRLTDRTQGPSSEVGGAVVSTIDGEPITVADIQRVVDATGWPSDRALRRLQDQRLLSREALRLGYGEDARLPPLLKRARVQALLAREIEAPTASDEDVAAFYEQAKLEFVHGENRGCVHVLATMKDPSAEESAAARAFGTEMVARFRQAAEPQDVVAWAKEYTVPPLGDGDPPFRVVAESIPPVPRRGALVDEFSDALFGLDGVGSVVGPIKTSFGWHAIYLTEIVPPEDRPLSEVRDEIAERLRLRQRPGALTERLNALLSEIGVKANKQALSGLAGVGQ